MSESGELCAIDEQGNDLLGSLLDPFWKTVLPGFLNRSDEIIIRASRLEPKNVGITYQKKDEIIQLNPVNGFHPFILSSRIRLISGMSIAPDISQGGKLTVGFKGKHLTVDVQIDVENEDEILRLKPRWE